jgi:hypothetical protein
MEPLKERLFVAFSAAQQSSKGHQHLSPNVKVSRTQRQGAAGRTIFQHASRRLAAGCRSRPIC